MKRTKLYNNLDPTNSHLASGPVLLGRRSSNPKPVRLRRGTCFMLAGLVGTCLLCPSLFFFFLKTYRAEGLNSITPLDQPETDLDSIHLDMSNPVQLKHHVVELSRIKTSVLNDLRSMEERYHAIKASIDAETGKLADVQRSVEMKSQQLERLEQQLDAERLSHRENVEGNIPSIWAPSKLAVRPAIESQDLIWPPGGPGSPGHSGSPPTTPAAVSCSMERCFDYSSCSVVSPFNVHVYQNSDVHPVNTLDTGLLSLIGKYIYSNNVKDSETLPPACVYLLILDVGHIYQRYGGSGGLKEFVERIQGGDLSGLWKGGGRNHIVYFQLSRGDVTGQLSKELILFAHRLRRLNWGEALVAAPFAIKSPSVDSYRSKFDVILPIPAAADDGFPPPLVPIRRRIFAHFSGFRLNPSHGDNSLMSYFQRQLTMIVDQNRATTDIFSFNFDCNRDASNLDDPNDSRRARTTDGFQLLDGDWLECQQNQNLDIGLRDSTFAIVPITNNSDVLISAAVVGRLTSALHAGAIPVLIGDACVPLPFDEFVDWALITVRLPYARLPELHFLLRSFGDTELAEMKRRGWLIYKAYFASQAKVVLTLLATLRTRLQIPDTPIRGYRAPPLYNQSHPMTVAEMPYVPAVDEYIGPIELPYNSMAYETNYSVGMTQWHFLWNHIAMPSGLYPFTPFRAVMPTEAKFVGTHSGYRLINKGAGGSGKEFSESLGGNNPREQFTIVLLTYERESVLIESLQTLNNLPYLNKIVVVWNSLRRPRPDLKWPKLSAQLEVVYPGKNSLNNRFLPYEGIATEAVLSLDDDAHLRHDEIVFGFRVWRENRERIVGFPGRFHAWDSLNHNWLYNSNHSCELSMVLTGAAFFHKFYAYQYSNEMPAEIRDKVDSLMNCEDIAMNFLVSHLTRQPPLKVTSRWTFRCPGCPETLSSDESHFRERHQCIQFFTKVYGYNPLLNTQFRLDSILFKTRLPHNHQKCFKFI